MMMSDADSIICLQQILDGFTLDIVAQLEWAAIRRGDIVTAVVLHEYALTCDTEENYRRYLATEVSVPGALVVIRDGDFD